MIVIASAGRRDPADWHLALAAPDALLTEHGPVHFVDDACVAGCAAAGFDLPAALRERFGLVRLAAAAGVPGRSLYGWAGGYTPIVVTPHEEVSP